MYNNKLLRFLKSFFLGFGINATVFVIANLINPDIFTIRYLWAFGLYALIISFAANIIFKEGVSVRSLWIRRIIIMGIMCFMIPAVDILIRIKEFGSISEFIKYSAIIVILIIIFAIPAYVILDKFEKNMLKKINDKLRQNKTNG